MKLGFVLAAVPLVLAHTHITKLFINGVDQGDMTCLRYPDDPSKLTFPVENLNSPAMACGTGGKRGVNRICHVPDGATLTFKYHKSPSDPSSGALESSHVGPCAVYLKRVEDAATDGASGDGWFKLWDMGYTDQWCTVKMAENGGLLTVNLPLGLAGGYYLVRPELLALHQAKDGNPQYYVSCAQVYIQSGGDLVPQTTVSIPGYCSKEDESNSFNVYNTPASNYKCPGPAPQALMNAAGTGNGNAPMDHGWKPEGCILEVGSNWCGFEVPSYQDQQGCWNAAKNCWAQADQCWNLAPQAMNNDCNIWNTKCEDLNSQCRNGNWLGPPNAGRDLTPTRTTIDPPQPLGPTRAPDASPPQYYKDTTPQYQPGAPYAASYEEASAPTPETFIVRWKLVCPRRGFCYKVPAE